MNDRAKACALLRRLRERRGWSWSDQARALRAAADRFNMAAVTRTQLTSLQRSIARWESAASHTVPGERNQLLLAHLYARDGSGRLAAGAGSDLDTVLTALSHFGVPARRIRELRDVVMQSVGVDEDQLLALLAGPTSQLVTDALRDPRRLDVDLIERLDAAISDLDRRIGSVPFVRLQLLLAPISEVCQRLRGPELRERLSMVRAKTWLLAGRIAFETRDDEAARRWYARAVQAAAEVTDSTRRAAVRTSYAMTVLHSAGADAARRIVDAAVGDARAGSDFRVLARAHALQAEIAVRSGRDRDAAAALRLAALALDAADPASAGFDNDRLRGFEGVCELHVGTAQQAHDHLDRSLAGLTAQRDQVQRGIASADLAIAQLRVGDVRAAIGLLHECVETTAATGGRVATQRIGLARRELEPWRNETFVTELDDHIFDTLLAT